MADALRANTTLQVLDLHDAHLCYNVPAACVVLRVLAGHPSLRQLELQDETPETTVLQSALLSLRCLPRIRQRFIRFISVASSSYPEAWRRSWTRCRRTTTFALLT